MRKQVVGICEALIVIFFLQYVCCQTSNSGNTSFLLIEEPYDVACKAALTQAFLQIDPCTHNLASDLQITEIFNATNVGLTNCGRDARIRVRMVSMVHGP